MDGNPAKFTSKFITSAYCKAREKKYTKTYWLMEDQMIVTAWIV